MNVLKIVIKKEYFDMIASGEKKIEYRDVSAFWQSRLYDKKGKKRSYDKIEFINGYNKNARRMDVKYEGLNKKGELYHILLGEILSVTK